MEFLTHISASIVIAGRWQEESWGFAENGRRRTEPPAVES
jgi:hypothetical protein